MLSIGQDKLTFLNFFSEHEEADIRMLLQGEHASTEGYCRLVFVCDDTDVLVLLLSHKIASFVWMKRSNPVRYIPIHDIASTLSDDIFSSLIVFHCLTGCDTTSQSSGIGKKRVWKTFTEYAPLLAGLGKARDVSSD